MGQKQTRDYGNKIGHEGDEEEYRHFREQLMRDPDSLCRFEDLDKRFIIARVRDILSSLRSGSDEKAVSLDRCLLGKSIDMCPEIDQFAVTPVSKDCRIATLNLSYNWLTEWPFRSQDQDGDQHDVELMLYMSGQEHDGVRIVINSECTLDGIHTLDISENHMNSLPRELDAWASSLTVLNLSGNKLIELPDSLFNVCTQLEQLNLARNKLQSLSPLVSQLTQLQHLDLSLNMISADKLPDMSTLTKLQVVLCDSLPSGFFEIHVEQRPVEHVSLPLLPNPSNLNQLVFRHNKITDVTSLYDIALETEGELHLDLSFNRLGHSPLSFERKQAEAVQRQLLDHVTTLDLSHNRLTTFDWLLTRLKKLYLRGNKLTEIPPTVIKMASQLEELDLSFNEITSLDALVSASETFVVLKRLGIAHCKLKRIVPEEEQDRKLLESLISKLDVFHFEFNDELDNATEQEQWVKKVLDLREPQQHIQDQEAKIIPSPSLLHDAIRGCLYGQAVGDAIGLATEFMNKKEATMLYGVAPIEYNNFFRDRHRFRWVQGDFTDDTDQLLLILDTFLNRQDGEVDELDFANRLFNWIFHGFAAMSDDGGFGLGQTVKTVVTDFNFLKDPHKSAREVWERSGRKIAPNGAVMRTAVLGILHHNNLDKVIEQTLAICKVTHFDPRCQASTVAICTTISLLLQDIESQKPFTADAINDIIQRAYDLACVHLPDKEAHEELHKYMFAQDFEDLKLDEGSSIGYTYKSMGSAFVALRHVALGEDAEAVMTALVREAGDADSNACVAGAVMGTVLGHRGLPQRWVDGLAHRQWFEHRVSALIALHDKVLA